MYGIGPVPHLMAEFHEGAIEQERMQQYVEVRFFFWKHVRRLDRLEVAAQERGSNPAGPEAHPRLHVRGLLLAEMPPLLFVAQCDPRRVFERANHAHGVSQRRM